jgi:hypothetical protein
MGEVISIIDPTKSGRIQVRITGVDDKDSDKNLIPCVPLLPKYLTTLPKVGESVFVFQYENNSSSPTSSFKTKRFWVGPLITQPTKLEGEPYNSTLSIMPDGYTKLKDPNLEIGAYSEDEDIVLQGRYNTDIIQKDRQIWLRVGKIVEGTPNKFNKENLGYIQLKYGGISKINTADNVFGIFTSRAMRERGRYQIQLMKTRSSSGVGQKVDLEFNLESLRITDPGEEGQSESGGFGGQKPGAIMDQIKSTSSVTPISQPQESAKINAGVDSTKLKQMLAGLKSKTE